MTTTDHDAPPVRRPGWDGRPRHAGIGDRAETERRAAEFDEVDIVDGGDDEATHRFLVSDRGSGGLAVIDDENEPDRSDLRVAPPRFWDEAVSLRELLELARRGDYALNHLRVVRAAHVAFFWLFTVPAYSVWSAVKWALASLWRALTVVVVVMVAAQAVPVVPFLVVASWTPTAWSWLGGIVLVFGLLTAVAAAVEKRREPLQ